MYHAYHGTFCLEVVSFLPMYHAEVVSFHLEVVTFRLEVVTYAKNNNLFGDSKYITVFFDRSGKVVEYNTSIIESNSQQPNGQQPQQPQQPSLPPYDGGYYPNGGMNYDYCLDDASFSKLYNKIKKTNFDLQNATDIYRIFTFDSDKEKAANILRNSR